MVHRETGITRKKIQFYWISRHCGVEVNERAA
jgi:hypothetical protein